MGEIFSELKKTQKLTQLLVLLSFLLTFLITRILVHVDAASPDINLSTVIGGIHIHHLVPGIFLLIISGYIGMSFWSKNKVRWAMAVLFGIGAALTIDEFALWLYLGDVYWQKQGRISIDAVIIFAILLFIAFSVSEVYGHRKAKRIPIIGRFFKAPKI